jgi:hypothetical protein
VKEAHPVVLYRLSRSNQSGLRKTAKPAARVRILFEHPESLIDIVVSNDDLQNVSNLLLAPDAPSSC